MDNFTGVTLECLCSICCFKGDNIYKCPYIDKLRFQLFRAPYMTRNHKCDINHCRAMEDRGCAYKNVTCANYVRFNYSTSIICSARKQAVNLVQSGKVGWRMLEHERQQRGEMEEAAEKAAWGAAEDIQLVTKKKTVAKQEVKRLVTRRGEDRD